MTLRSSSLYMVITIILLLNVLYIYIYTAKKLIYIYKSVYFHRPTGAGTIGKVLHALKD